MTDTPQLKRTKLSHSGTTAVLALASDKVNALDHEVLGEISAFVEYCEQDPGVAALVLTGEGSVFSAGLNVNEVLSNATSYTDDLLDALNDALVRVFRCPKPTVVAINGAAIAGGCILAAAFDKRLIAEEARIGVTELKVGVSFPVGGHRALEARLRLSRRAADIRCRIAQRRSCVSERHCASEVSHGTSCRRRRWPRRRSSRHSMQGRMRWRRRRPGALRSPPWRMTEPTRSIETCGTNGRTIGRGPIWSSCSSRRPDHPQPGKDGPAWSAADLARTCG